MRPITFALMLAAQPVLADPVAVALPCDAAVAQPCVAAFGLRNFDPLYAQPVVLGDRMRLVGVTRGADGTDRMILLDIALAGGDIVQGMTPLDATAEEMLDTDSPDYMPFRPTAEVSPDGQVVALFTHAPGAEGLPALQFFDGSGKRLGRLDAPYGPDWPVDMEWSAVNVFAHFAGQNAFAFDASALRLALGGFVLSVAVADGRMTVAATTGGDLATTVGNTFDPVGSETLWLGPRMAAIINAASDGFPSQFAMAPIAVTTPPDTSVSSRDAEAVVLDPNDGDYSRDYMLPVMSADGALIAVIRTADEPETGPIDLLVYEVASARLIWSAALDDASPRPSPRNLVWTADNRLVLIEAPVEDQMRITIFDPAD